MYCQALIKTLGLTHLSYLYYTVVASKDSVLTKCLLSCAQDLKTDFCFQTSTVIAPKYSVVSQSPPSFAQDFKADFLKRPEGDVHFICNDGLAVKELVETVAKSNERHNFKLSIDAIVPSLSPEIVAKFELTLSLKDKS